MKFKRLLSVVLCLLIAASTTMLTVNAKAKKFVKSIKVTKKATITIPASKKTVTKSYKVTVKVSGKASKKFKVKSSKSSVASAKVSGSKVKVIAKKSGKTVITVTAKAKSKKGKALSAKLTVTVKKAKKAAKKSTTPTTPSTPSDSDTPSNPSTPSNPDTPSTPTVRNITLNTTLTEISRKGSSGQNEQGEETVVDIPLWQASSVFNYVPANVEELKQVHRADAVLPNKVDAAITDSTDGSKGRFEVVALYFAALKAFDPKNPEVAYAMMEEICESPEAKLKGHDIFTNFSRSAMKDNLTKSNKYTYLGNAYFDGAEPANKYTPSDPPTVTLEDYVYSSQVSNQYQTQIYKITSRFKGADTERIIQVYQSQGDGKWYIFSDSWMGFTSDIKAPSLF